MDEIRGWVEQLPGICKGQDILHFSLEQEQVEVQGIQVQEFLAGKSGEHFYFSELMPGNFFLCAFHLESEIKKMRKVDFC